jgi:hypothetical protein
MELEDLRETFDRLVNFRNNLGVDISSGIPRSPAEILSGLDAALAGPPRVACKHDFREYSIDNAASPLDEAKLFVWVKCIKCGLGSV